MAQDDSLITVVANAVDDVGQTTRDFTVRAKNSIQNADTVFNTFAENIGTELGLSQVVENLRAAALPDSPVPAFENCINVFDRIEGPRIKEGLPTATDFDENISGFEILEKNLQKALASDWRVNGKNKNILDAFVLSGYDYSKDGYKAEYNWNVAFVNYILSKSGIRYLRTCQVTPYENYGTSIPFSRFDKVRKNDILVFKTIDFKQVLGFVQSYDPATRTCSAIVGNANRDVRLVKNIPVSGTNPKLRLVSVRRNWDIPEKLDKPLYNVKSARNPNNALDQFTNGLESIIDAASNLDIKLDFGVDFEKDLRNIAQQIDNDLGKAVEAVVPGITQTVKQAEQDLTRADTALRNRLKSLQ